MVDTFCRWVSAFALFVLIGLCLAINPSKASAQNGAPMLSPLPGPIVSTGGLVTFPVSCTDPDGDAVAITVIGAPNGSTLSMTVNGTSTFSWTPSFTQTGTWSVTFVCSDGTDSDRGAMTIVVMPASNPPILAPIGDQTVRAGSLLTFQVTASQASSGILLMNAAPLPQGATYTDTGMRAGIFRWIPDANQVGDYRVVFSVTDGATRTIEPVVITVEPPADIPLEFATLLRQVVDEGEQLAFGVRCFNANNAPLTYTFDWAGPTTSRFDEQTGQFSWRPTYLHSGLYDFRVTCEDGGGRSAEALGDIVVREVEDPPSIRVSPGPHFAPAEAPFGLTVSATDPDAGDTLRYSTLSLPDGARFDEASGAFDWTPGLDQIGSHRLIFEVTDGILQDSAVTEIVVVRAEAPTFDPLLPISGQVGTPLMFTVTARDADADDRVTLSTAQLPSGATFLAPVPGNPARGELSWPNPIEGEHYLTLSATDGRETTSVEVLIRVDPRPSNPLPRSDPNAGGTPNDVPQAPGNLALAEPGCGCATTHHRRTGALGASLMLLFLCLGCVVKHVKWA